MSATPLLLLHGALGSADQFDAVCAYCSNNRTLLRFDLPGHGGAPAQGPFSIPAFADAVLRWLDRRGIAAVDIFGYSMGGYIALYLAWKYPERVRQILTLGTKMDWTPETAAREAGRLDPIALETKAPQFAQMLAERHAPVDWKTVLRQTARLLAELGEGPDLPAEAWPAIGCPVVIGRGELDNMVGEAESATAAAALPQGRYHVLPGVKHPLEQVDPAALARYIEEHLV